jgi:hypothetical protein
MRTLAREALYSSESYDEHRLRGRRHVDGQEHPEGITDLSRSTDVTWSELPERLERADPTGARARAIVGEILGR